MGDGPNDDPELIDQNAHLREALKTRDVIGQAKGILMERYRIDADAAFELLAKASQNHHVKLSALAEHLVHTGQFDPPSA